MKAMKGVLLALLQLFGSMPTFKRDLTKEARSLVLSPSISHFIQRLKLFQKHGRKRRFCRNKKLFCYAVEAVPSVRVLETRRVFGSKNGPPVINMLLVKVQIINIRN